MKKSFLIAIALLLTLTSCKYTAEQTAETSLSLLSLKGPIKSYKIKEIYNYGNFTSIQEEIYEFNIQGNITETKTFVNGQPNIQIKQEYQDGIYLTRAITLNEKNEIIATEEYTYDNKKRLVKTTKFKGDGTVFEIIDVKYDRKGRAIEERYTNENNKVYYISTKRYNGKDLITYHKEEDIADTYHKSIDKCGCTNNEPTYNCTTETHCQYDNEGRIISLVKKNSKDEYDNYKLVYKYEVNKTICEYYKKQLIDTQVTEKDDKGNEIKHIFYNSKGEIEAEKAIYYDEDGEAIRITYISTSGDSNEKSFTYKKDRYGNKIEVIEKNKDIGKETKHTNSNEGYNYIWNGTTITTTMEIEYY